MPALRISRVPPPLGLVAAVRLDLAGVAAHHDGLEALAGLGELAVLLVGVVDQLAGHAPLDHTVGEREGGVAVAVAAVVMK